MPTHKPYTSKITNIFRVRSPRFRLTTDHYLRNFETAKADAIFQLAADPALVWACHDATHNRWMFSRYRPSMATHGRWQARGTKYYVLSTLPQMPTPITQHSPLWFYEGEAPNGTWRIVEHIHEKRPASRRTITDPYVLRRLQEVRNQPQAPNHNNSSCT